MTNPKKLFNIVSRFAVASFAIIILLSGLLTGKIVSKKDFNTPITRMTRNSVQKGNSQQDKVCVSKACINA
ncbi:unnamed protein product, partial [Brachionus calyciflorus]